MVRGECGGGGGVSANAVNSGLPSPAEIIFWSAEVIPAEVVIHVVSHPRHWKLVWSSGGRAPVFFPAVPLPGFWGGNPGAGVHPPAGGKFGYGPPRTHQ